MGVVAENGPVANPVANTVVLELETTRTMASDLGMSNISAALCIGLPLSCPITADWVVDSSNNSPAMMDNCSLADGLSK